MSKLLKALAALSAVVVMGAQADPTTIYTDRASFLGAVRQSMTDTFSDYGGPIQLTNAQMHAVKGETRFEPLTFPDENLIDDYRYRPGDKGYCAGCNGNFRLWFDAMSLSRAGGVFGVALDIVLHTSRRVSIGDDDLVVAAPFEADSCVIVSQESGKPAENTLGAAVTIYL